MNAKVIVSLDLFLNNVKKAAEGLSVGTIISFGVNNDMPLSTDLVYRLKTIGKSAYTQSNDVTVMQGKTSGVFQTSLLCFL